MFISVLSSVYGWPAINETDVNLDEGNEDG